MSKIIDQHQIIFKPRKARNWRGPYISVHNLERNIANRVRIRKWQSDMFAKLTTSTSGGLLAWREVEVGDGLVQDTAPWVTESLVPQVDGGRSGEEGLW
jgi:hypothetical protein